jgi:DNA-binding transcriptional MerR regulator
MALQQISFPFGDEELPQKPKEEEIQPLPRPRKGPEVPPLIQAELGQDWTSPEIPTEGEGLFPEDQLSLGLESPKDPAEPELPHVPAEPALPKAPPELPKTPSEPELPQVPSGPETPSLPSEPEMPNLPSEPELPNLPSEPGIPKEPSEPEVPVQTSTPRISLAQARASIYYEEEEEEKETGPTLAPDAEPNNTVSDNPNTPNRPEASFDRGASDAQGNTNSEPGEGVSTVPQGDVSLWPADDTIHPDGDVSAEAHPEPEALITLEPEAPITVEQLPEPTAEPEAPITVEQEPEPTAEPEAMTTVEPEAPTTVEPEPEEPEPVPAAEIKQARTKTPKIKAPKTLPPDAGAETPLWPEETEKEAPVSKSSLWPEDTEGRTPFNPKKIKIQKGGRGRKSMKELAATVDLVEIPDDDLLFQKQYYSIGEVASMFKVNTSLIRFWETEFTEIRPRKNKKGDRSFSPMDIKIIQLIHFLLRQKKLTIEGAKEYLKAHNKDGNAKLEMIRSMEKIKAFLLELKARL